MAAAYWLALIWSGTECCSAETPSLPALRGESALVAIWPELSAITKLPAQKKSPTSTPDQVKVGLSFVSEGSGPIKPCSFGQYSIL